MTPRVAGVQGAALLYAAQCAKGGWLAKQTPAQRGVSRCARRSARRGKGAGVLPRPGPPKPPARLGGAAPGVRYASRPDGRNVPGWTAQAERCPRPTLIRGPGASEHLQSDRHGPPGFARLAQPPAKPAAALQRLAGCATAGARPAAALGGGLDRGRRLAPTRAPPLWSERSERNRRGAQPRGWEGVGPQAVGCGLLLGSRGHPIPFAVTAQQAPCGRCIGRPAGASHDPRLSRGLV